MGERKGPRRSPPSKRTSERREAARRAEAERQRQDLRRRRIRLVAWALVLALAFAALYLYSTRSRPVSAEASALIGRAPDAARAAGCTGVQTVREFPGGLDRTHIGDGVSAPPLSHYPSTPPASGPHAPAPLDAGIYGSAPPIYRAIHSLEHGAVVVWLAPDALASSAGPLTGFFGKPAEHDHVIVAPYDYPDQGAAGRLASGESMVLVAWHRVERCRDVSLPAAAAFVKAFASPTQALALGRPRGYEGEAPEAGAGI